MITLTTDFGSKDEYAGVMRGVIGSLAPGAAIVDLTHGIEPHNRLQAAYVVARSAPFFPVGSIHVVVVDPGVGSQRKIIAVRTEAGFFLSPDNGILTCIADTQRILSAVSVENPDVFLHAVSSTFHGRDVFAPAAANLWRHRDVLRLGPEIDPGDIVRIAEAFPEIGPEAINAQVLWIDHFGNVVTNIDETMRQALDRNDSKNRICLTFNGKTVVGLYRCYTDLPSDGCGMIIGSRGLIEISALMRNAAEILSIKTGDTVVLTMV